MTGDKWEQVTPIVIAFIVLTIVLIITSDVVYVHVIIVSLYVQCIIYVHNTVVLMCM